jgi:WD40 repeat protein
LLAVASSDVRIITLKDISNHTHRPQHALIDSTAQSNTRSSSPVPKYEIQQIAKFDDHATRVWRLSWNLTGTILASSGEDGRVRLWKCE